MHVFLATIAADDADSDSESAWSHLSLDEDLQSVAGDGTKLYMRDINSLTFTAAADSTLTEGDESMLQQKLGDYLDNAAHKKYHHHPITITSSDF